MVSNIYDKKYLKPLDNYTIIACRLRYSTKFSSLISIILKVTQQYTNQILFATCLIICDNLWTVPVAMQSYDDYESTSTKILSGQLSLTCEYLRSCGKRVYMYVILTYLPQIGEIRKLVREKIPNTSPVTAGVTPFFSAWIRKIGP